ncbi:MAG: hypothetical protein QW561_01325 [Candidatus Aenigmatarchaeota archaeon]
MAGTDNLHEAFNHLVNSKKSFLFALRTLLDALLPSKRPRRKSTDIKSMLLYEARRCVDLLIRELDNLFPDAERVRRTAIMKEIKEILDEKKSSLTQKQKEDLIAGIDFCLRVIDEELKRFKSRSRPRKIEIL